MNNWDKPDAHTSCTAVAISTLLDFLKFFTFLIKSVSSIQLNARDTIAMLPVTVIVPIMMPSMSK